MLVSCNGLCYMHVIELVQGAGGCILRARSIRGEDAGACRRTAPLREIESERGERESRRAASALAVTNVEANFGRGLLLTPMLSLPISRARAPWARTHARRPGGRGRSTVILLSHLFRRSLGDAARSHTCDTASRAHAPNRGWWWVDTRHSLVTASEGRNTCRQGRLFASVVLNALPTLINQP